MPTKNRASGARLFAGYAVASLIPILLLGGLLAHSHTVSGRERGIEQGLSQAAVIEEMAVSPSLSGDPLERGLTLDEQRQLRSATDLAIYHGSVVGLRLRSFDGDVVFADDGRLVSDVPITDPDFQAAAAGTPTARVFDDSATYGTVIRVITPVVATPAGRSVGVLELYLPYDAIAAQITDSTRATFWRLFAGLLLLYVLLAVISWSTSRRLRKHAARHEHEATHDSLTGLPNRAYFHDRIEDMIRRRTPGAVVLIDLDRFKEVNDSLGHHAGDELLIQVADRLRTSPLRTDDTIARLGGDEFGLVLPNITQARHAFELVEQARLQLLEPFVLDEDVPLSVEASFGIAMFPGDADDAESLLRYADAAMYQGKRGTHGIVVFDAALNVTKPHPLNIQTEMRRAIDQDELLLHYQPQIDLGTGEITSVEALLRWQHPKRGLLMPADFLAAVEPTGLISPLTDWVVRRALADCVDWTAAGHSWGVAVNVSARNLESPDFAARIRILLRESGVDPARLRLEVTETALAVDVAAVSATLERLAKSGVSIAMDDFGVGYASLAHLRQLALSEVKIDRGFVAAVTESRRDRRMVTSLVELVHGLGLRVTAEGVETEDTARWLREVGCDSAQGYHFARPAPWRTLVAPELPAPRSSESVEAPA